MVRKGIFDSGWATIVMTTVALLIVTGCDPPLGAPTVPEDVAVPSTVGVVGEIAQQSDGALVTLEDGGTVLLPNGARDLTGPAEVGRLIIVGHGGPDAPDRSVWYAAVRSWGPDCFRIVANGEIRGGRMALSEGFSLPLSDRWDETETSFVSSPVRGFCLDDFGAVVRPYS